MRKFCNLGTFCDVSAVVTLGVTGVSYCAAGGCLRTYDRGACVLTFFFVVFTAGGKYATDREKHTKNKKERHH